MLKERVEKRRKNRQMASVDRIKKAIADLRTIPDRHEDIDIVCDAAESYASMLKNIARDLEERLEQMKADRKWDKEDGRHQ